MTDLDLAYRSAVKLAADIRRKRLSPVELIKNCLDRIDAVNGKLNCFCFVYPEEAMMYAKQAEKAVVSGARLGPLHGIPIAIKDVTPTKNKTTTRGSRIYENWTPDYDALIVDRLVAAGAILVGKTTTPEFACDSFTQSPLWGITRNPWDLDRTPGGSSGGAGAAVATGCVALAEGSDMGGSIRIPAALCGVVGLKPSLGRIPVDIVPTVFDSITHLGPLARTVGDTALFMNVAAGPDERDIQSLTERLELPIPSETDVQGTRIALSADLGYYALDPMVEAAVNKAANTLAKLGADIEEVELGWTRAINDAWVAHWGVYLDVCFTPDLDRWREQMDPNVVKLVEDGRKMDAVSLKNIEVLRTKQWHSLCSIFERCDALLCATTSVPAPRHGSTDSEFHGTRDNGRYQGLDLTLPFNFVGQCPAISVPAGFSPEGLPLGVQIVGRRYDEFMVMRIAAALEQALPWVHHRPPI